MFSIFWQRSVIFLLGLVSSCVIAAPDQSKLKQINQKIASIQAALSAEQQQRMNYLKSLKNTELAADQALLKLQQTAEALHKQQMTLSQLNQRTALYHAKLSSQEKILADQMRSAYLLGRQPMLKLALNQSDANRFSRLMMYYHYISKNRLTVIQDLAQTLNVLENTQQQTQHQTTTLTTLQLQQQAERKKLEQVRENRALIVTQLNQEINHKQQKLSVLLANKKLLEQTIDQLEKSANMRPVLAGNFARFQGQLNWPTAGKVLPYFGTKIYQSELKWDGILIEAAENKPVYAVADGQVVFAKWLPGYGLLLIISHGHGYMTLYGRNHHLYKKAGDLVRTGDLIATVGDSGGYEKTALYFAIRHNAIPLNPMSWCHHKA